MKKIIFAVVAVVAMASCSKDEVIEVNREQIGFGDVFVDNATRADYSSNNKKVNAFKVYGTVKTTAATTQIFNGADVNRDGKADGVAWTLSGTKHYWLPGATYNFAAIVDGVATATEGLPATIPFTVADGVDNKDLLYATATVTTNANAVPTGVNANGVVAFEFQHLLSKLQFKIKNETNQNYVVTSISVTGVAEDGIYTVGAATPWAQVGTDTTTLTFGNATVDGGATVAASEARQLLPVQQTLDITITYDVMDDGDVVGELTKKGKIENKTFEANKVYVVTATLTGTAIDFSFGTLGGWTNEDLTI